MITIIRIKIMGRLMLSSDLHLGHNNICKYREGFSSAEEHNEILFENLATNINKNDTLYLLGDISFNKYWLDRISEIKCRHKKLVLGNHDIRGGITIQDLSKVYDSIEGFFKKGGYWFSHCPIHPDEMRTKFGNIHGHTHVYNLEDPRYINVSVDQTGLKPVSFQKLIKAHQNDQRAANSTRPTFKHY